MSGRTRTFVVLLAAAGALAVAAGCTPGTPSGGGSSAPAPAGSATGAPTPGGGDTGGGGGGGSSTPAVTYPTDADAYSRKAITAWRDHDTATLNALNAPSDTVFATLNAGNYNTQFTTLYTCEGAAGSSYCTYYNAVGDTLRLQLRNDLLGKAHAIIGGTLIPITFPTDYQAYAQEALDDWRAHNSAAVALLTGKSGDTAFASVPASARSANTTWTFSHQEGAAGHQIFVWLDQANNELAFDFINPTIQSPPANHHGLILAVYYSPHA